MEYIKSADNLKIKNIKKLMDKKYRQLNEKYVIEGKKMILEAVSNDVEIEEFYISEIFLKKENDLVNKLKSKFKVYVVDDNLFEKISDTKTPQGIMAIVKINNVEFLLRESENFYLILDSIQDPGNMGTIIRTAEAFGVNGIILTPDCVDIYNPKVIRSTMGSIFRMNIKICKNIMNTIKDLKNNGFKIFVSDLEADNYCFNEDYTKKCAIIVGNEALGVDSQIKLYADKKVMIPMNGLTESINVSVATGILLYEVYRQRVGGI